MTNSALEATASLSSKNGSSQQRVQPRITKVYMDIQTDLVYSCTGYDITSYFQLAVIVKINRIALGGILVAWRFAWA